MVDENLARIKRNQKKLVPLIFGLVVFVFLLILITPNLIKSIYTDDCICHVSYAQKSSFNTGFTCGVQDVINVVPGVYCYLTYLVILSLFVAGLFKLKRTLLAIEKK
jgi:hypothetical protein